jgi:hypothetical protein
VGCRAQWWKVPLVVVGALAACAFSLFSKPKALHGYRRHLKRFLSWADVGPALTLSIVSFAVVALPAQAANNRHEQNPRHKSRMPVHPLTAWPGAAADVSITSCKIAPPLGVDQQAYIKGMVLNSSSATYDYQILVNVLEGTRRVGVVVGNGTDVGPGQRSTWVTSGKITGAKRSITCQLASVQRHPAEPSPPDTTLPQSTAEYVVGLPISCKVNPAVSDQADVSGEIMNLTDTTIYDFTISVEFLEGTLVVGNAQATDDDVDPEQSSIWSASGEITGGNGGPIRCSVSVQQTSMPANPTTSG